MTDHYQTEQNCTAGAASELTDVLAITLGNVARITNGLLRGALSGIGNGERMNLRIPVPMILSNSEPAEHQEAGILPTSTTVVGELLRIDLNLIECFATRNFIFIFLEALLAPQHIAGGKFGVIFENDRKGIVVLTRNAWLNSVHVDSSIEMANSEGKPRRSGA